MTPDLAEAAAYSNALAAQGRFIDTLIARIEALEAGLKKIATQAEDSAFVAAAVEPNERSIVILGKRFQAIQTSAANLLGDRHD